MAEFLTTQGSSYYVEHIVRNAKKQLVLISPYLQLSPTLVQRLKDADEQNVQITLVCRKDKINPEESDRLRQLKNLAVYCHETIHAKCYFNEDTMVITSMNIYVATEKKNREMGILIRRETEPKIFEDAVREFESIKRESMRFDLGRQQLKPFWTPSKQAGYCIGCGTKKPFDLDKPYCNECYWEWQDVDDGDPTCEESHCHACGEKTEASKKYPLCDSCYRKSLR